MDDCNKKSEELVEEIKVLSSHTNGGGRDRRDGEQGDDSEQDFGSELREVFENMPVGMYRTAPDGRILMANPALVRMLGFSSFEELAQRNLEENGFEPDYGRRLFKERVERDGKIVGLESVWTTRQGSRLVIIENARAVRDQEGNIQYYEGTAEDITERKKVEDELRSSQERLKILFESAPDGIYLYDLKGTVVDGNKAAEELVGFTRAELIGKNLAGVGLLSEEQMPKAAENLQENVLGEPTGPDEFTLRRKDGSSVTVEIRTFPVTIDGQALSLGIARDITERKRVERATEERLRFEQMVSAISGRFVNLPADEIDKVIKNGLALVGEFFGVDRVVIGELVGERKEARTRHIWLSERCDGRVNALAREITYPNVAAHLQREGAFVYSKPDDLPKGWKEEREFIDAAGINSGMIVPLRVGGVFLGAVSINSLDSERVWPDGTVERLALMGEILANALNRKRVDEALLYRVEFERLISTLSTRFIEPGDIDQKIKRTLAAIGEFAGVDRAYIFQVRDGGVTVDNTHEWCAEGITPEIDTLKGISPDDVLPWFWQRMKACEVFHVPAVAELPVEANLEKEHFEKQGIQSLIVVPMVFQSELSGFLGFDSVRCEKTWHEDIITLLWLAGENISRALVRKRTERALRQQRDLAQKYLDVAGVMFVMIDADRKVRLINKKGCEILGYDEEDVVGKDWFDNFLPEDLREDVGVVFDALIAGDAKPVEYYENPVIGKDGSERLIAWHNTLLRYEDGRIIGSLSSGEDITERKRAEDVLRAEKNKLTAIFEAMVDGAYIVNEQCDIEYVNPVLEKEFGRWQGRKCYAYFHDRKEICPWCKNKDVFAGKTVRWEWYSFKNERTYDLIDTPLQNPDGSISKLEIFRDITERKQAEEKTREHQNELAHVWRVNTMGEMASGFAHELNQPLCAILNYANACSRIMKSGADESGKVAEALEQIASQADRAGRIIKGIRGLVAKRKPHVSAVDINGIVREVVEMVRSEARLKNIGIRTELAEDMAGVLADSVEIEEVILNLVRNAFEAISDPSLERREVTIATRLTEDGAMEICVRDTGKGLAGLGERIFDSFFTTKADGLGIGLSISRTIVESYGGRLRGESNSDGGASFRFTLPLEGV